ncbi:hypothetical protein NDU88_003156 [Pleurodeles waltl]|uniref:Uncharacterized protein n=1 Tax=Pleurodeles waltl TaxID=8319 RepID=A0AAV7WQR9_PLEWA|nr:hypothetical protein NDU88_003156 [Pleurodeles waltl]
MGTRPPRGRHSEVALTTTDDGAQADWPAGGQRPWIPQEAESEETATEKATSEETATEKATSEETATEKATSEETATEKATSEETATEKATSEEKGGGNGGGGEPRNPRQLLYTRSLVSAQEKICDISSNSFSQTPSDIK